MKVKINLDKERDFEFTMGSFEMLADKYGSVMDALAKFRAIDDIRKLNGETIKIIIDLIHSGLRPFDDKITRDKVANILTMENMGAAILTVGRALGLSLPEPSGGGQNPPEA